MPDNEDVLIDRAGDADLAWCAELMAATDPWVTLGRDLAACTASLRRPGAELFVARRDGEAVGFILLHPHGVAGSPYVAVVAVAPSARGGGLGARLLDFAERHYPGARHIFLCVSDFNDGARRLYERVGYRLVGELKDYVAPGHSELLMHKRLA